MKKSQLIKIIKEQIQLLKEEAISVVCDCRNDNTNSDIIDGEVGIASCMGTLMTDIGIADCSCCDAHCRPDKGPPGDEAQINLKK